MGLKFEDLEFDEPWLVVDALVGDDVPLPATTVQYCDPARPATFVRGPGDLKRWEIMLLPGEDAAEMVAEEKIWQLLSRWLTPDQGSIWRDATSRFQDRMSVVTGTGVAVRLNIDGRRHNKK